MIDFRKDELAFLNLMLDNCDIFAVPSLKDITISPLLSRKISLSLIKKGVLKNENEFSLKGADEVCKITQYKSSRKYVRIGALIMGLYASDRAVTVIFNPFTETYSFNRIALSSEDNYLQSEYSFLTMENAGDAMPDQTISFEKLSEKISFKPGNAVYLSIRDVEEEEKNPEGSIKNLILFYYGGNHYCYDYAGNRLEQSSPEKSQKILYESVKINE